MGGNAFAGQHLSTPRMPPEVYFQVKEQTLAILRQHYKYAGVPIERPAKVNHGDIDVLVAEPRSGRALTAEQFGLALNAQYHFTPKGSPTTHFALLWPDITSSDQALAASTSQTQKYIQLDLHVLPNPACLVLASLQSGVRRSLAHSRQHTSPLWTHTQPPSFLGKHTRAGRRRIQQEVETSEDHR